MANYSIGIDFGTLSARAVIINTKTGEEVGTATCEYKHAVISDTFIDGSALPKDYALQHPQDYLDALASATKGALSASAIDPREIVGVGVDFTASTVMPVYEDGEPLCFNEQFKNSPQAYVKLWKHHAAQGEADEINELARETGAPWLSRYGGIISCEWLFPKVLETLRLDEGVYNAADRFVEAGDWIVWKLTGSETHSVCTTGFKAIWDEEHGYPENEFLKKLDARLDGIVGTKISKKVTKLNCVAGYITKEAAELTGLCEGTPVMPALIDAHGAFPALGITEAGSLLMIIGTSTCHIPLADKAKNIPGISGYVKDGIISGLYAYEAGQACVGDTFDWFVKNCVPASYEKEAKDAGISIHKLLREKAKALPAGSGGIIALDWWNGNRTPYVDGTLSGVIVGLTIGTKPEQIYRALIEATAYGTKRIIDIYEASGIEINALYAAGGIAEKDELLMQIYADVTGREIKLSGTAQACAYGSAVLGATNDSEYKNDFTLAAAKLKKIKDVTYKPNEEDRAAYEKLYAKYVELSEYFANGGSDVMKIIKN